LVTGKTIEEACNLAILIERAAKLQLLAMPAAEVHPFLMHLYMKLMIGFLRKKETKYFK